jgi:lipoyl-dependent peroxiredoxin
MAHNEHVIYTANAHVTGGRAAGHGRTSDGALEVDLRAPLERGGEGGGTNPEQLFAIGYAACFESALAGVARRRRLDVGDVGDRRERDADPDGEPWLRPSGDPRRHAAVDRRSGRRRGSW